MKPKILVVGSFVMDLIVTTQRFCNAGETVIGNGFSTAPGGKGANQAVQAARLGADVTMVGKVGNDDFGRNLIHSAAQSGVNTDYIFTTDSAPTAVGNVQIQKNESGTENRIIVVPGANFEITEADVAFLEEKIADYDMVILQHEIPQAVNCKVAAYAKAKGIPVMLNPAPSAEVPKELISCLTYISPNEHEAEDIVGIKPESDRAIEHAITALHDMGVTNVLITLGKAGCAFSDGEKVMESPSVNMGVVVDPTAAGDSFIGAFCTAVAAGVDYEQALVFANCTASITVSRMGAQTSLPTYDEVLSAMREKGFDTEIYQIIKGE
ncbi:MAG: ribokinase [Clostridia bacterium]|nr:ribokinase [Clostridia bacterium]